MLSPAGIEASREIGQAFQQLKIPVSTVLASPLCRAKETAKLAFGQVTTTEKLMGEDRDKQRSREVVGDDLKQFVRQRSRSNSNLVLVGHFGSSLALGRILSEGEAMVLGSALKERMKIRMIKEVQNTLDYGRTSSLSRL